MLDLGRTLIATAERSPDALALVDGDLRLDYGALAALHRARQIAGVIVTPVNWRFTADELDYCLGDAEARAAVFEEASAAAVEGAKTSRAIPKSPVGKILRRMLVAGEYETEA
jgi:2-furoate---CoA ligase